MLLEATIAMLTLMFGDVVSSRVGLILKMSIKVKSSQSQPIWKKTKSRVNRVKNRAGG